MKKKSHKRVDAWFKERYPALSNRQREEAIFLRWVVGRDGKTLKKGQSVEETELCYDKLNDELRRIEQGNSDVKIPVLHLDKEWCVVDKPAGIPCNPISLQDTNTVSHWALSHFQKKIAGFAGSQPKLCPHRLDTGTRGLVIVCFTIESYEMWRTRFKEKKVKKEYLAWCWGIPQADQWTIRFPIAKALGDSAKRLAVTSNNVRYVPPILRAETEVEVIQKKKSRFLARIQMKTGVTHQVRVHLAASGFPLVGDKLYDSDYEKRWLSPPFHLLKAVKLECGEWGFCHPEAGFKLERC